MSVSWSLTSIWKTQEKIIFIYFVLIQIVCKRPTKAFALNNSPKQISFEWRSHPPLTHILVGGKLSTLNQQSPIFDSNNNRNRQRSISKLLSDHTLLPSRQSSSSLKSLSSSHNSKSVSHNDFGQFLETIGIANNQRHFTLTHSREEGSERNVPHPLLPSTYKMTGNDLRDLNKISKSSQSLPNSFEIVDENKKIGFLMSSKNLLRNNPKINEKIQSSKIFPNVKLDSVLSFGDPNKADSGVPSADMEILDLKSIIEHGKHKNVQINEDRYDKMPLHRVKRSMDQEVVYGRKLTDYFPRNEQRLNKLKLLALTLSGRVIPLELSFAGESGDNYDFVNKEILQDDNGISYLLSKMSNDEILRNIMKKLANARESKTSSEKKLKRYSDDLFDLLYSNENELSVPNFGIKLLNGFVQTSGNKGATELGDSFKSDNIPASFYNSQTFGDHSDYFHLFPDKFDKDTDHSDYLRKRDDSIKTSKRSYRNRWSRNRPRCNYRRVTRQMLLEYFLTGKMCGSNVVRVRFGLG